MEEEQAPTNDHPPTLPVPALLQVPRVLDPLIRRFFCTISKSVAHKATAQQWDCDFRYTPKISKWVDVFPVVHILSLKYIFVPLTASHTCLVRFEHAFLHEEYATEAVDTADIRGSESYTITTAAPAGVGIPGPRFSIEPDWTLGYSRRVKPVADFMGPPRYYVVTTTSGLSADAAIDTRLYEIFVEVTLTANPSYVG